MGYWKFAFSEALSRTWELLTGGFVPAVIAIAIFAATVFFAHRFRGKEEMREWLWDGAIGLAATLSVGMLVFIFQLLFIAPMTAHEEGVQEIEKRDEVHSQDVQKKASLNVQLTNTQNELNAANIRATNLSDAAIRGRADIKDEPIASASATCVIDINSNAVVNTSYAAPGAIVALTLNGKALLAAQCDEAEAHTLSPGEVEYRIKCSAASDGPWMGQPTGDMGTANLLIVHVAKGILPVGSQIISGHVVWVVNNEAAQRFEIPSQAAQECENGNASGFGVPLIPGKDLSSLRDATSSTPDTLASPH